MKVALFIPCLVEQFHPEVGIATAKVLARIGVEVHYPQGQTCCGQPVYKSGLVNKTIPIAKHFIRVFEDAEAIVAPSGSCVSMVKNEYPLLLKDQPSWYDRAVDLAAHIYELTEFLVDHLHVEDLGSEWNGKAVYHDSCQVMRALGIYEQPCRLLSRVKGLELVDMERHDLCCGFGGPFSFKFP